ncbi:unnamed protein product [Caenorhabditis auriculariae]|uniref:EGF-like domain-containing protein n=1 Tax=Caenorhabditis auriculariae TaxID=2777116 RepID=A0A8S1H3V7_9PELO|nr:unnamed protein product [Caenorhabditis auriculariae]
MVMILTYEKSDRKNFGENCIIHFICWKLTSLLKLKKSEKSGGLYITLTATTTSGRPDGPGVRSEQKKSSGVGNTSVGHGRVGEPTWKAINREPPKSGKRRFVGTSPRPLIKPGNGRRFISRDLAELAAAKFYETALVVVAPGSFVQPSFPRSEQMAWLRNVLFTLVVVGFVACALRKRKPCINGTPEGDSCFCNDGWTGIFCHRRMNCSGYERLNNGSCVECARGWKGPDCDEIDCIGGKPNYDITECRCEEPYSGRYCELQDTKDIYKWYNNASSSIGPIGVLTIIPLALIYFFCDRCAKKRQLRRVEDHLNGTMPREKVINADVLKELLEEKPIDEKETQVLIP